MAQVCLCKFADECPFFDELLEEPNGLVRALKGQYCMGKFELCARYQALGTVGRDHVPLDLWPNDKEYLSRIIGPH